MVPGEEVPIVATAAATREGFREPGCWDERLWQGVRTSAYAVPRRKIEQVGPRLRVVVIVGTAIGHK